MVLWFSVIIYYKCLIVLGSGCYNHCFRRIANLAGDIKIYLEIRNTSNYKSTRTVHMIEKTSQYNDIVLRCHLHCNKTRPICLKFSPLLCHLVNNVYGTAHVSGFIWVMENLQSHGILEFSFSRPGKSLNLSVGHGKSRKMVLIVKNKLGRLFFVKKVKAYTK